MKIPLNEISTAGLFKLLRDVSAELEARMSAPVYHRVRDVLPLKTLRVPAEDDADFVLICFWSAKVDCPMAFSWPSPRPACSWPSWF